MKPFNLKEALAGKKVITRDGREVLEIFHLASVTESDEYPVFAAVKEDTGAVFPHTFTVDGSFNDRRTNRQLDLFMAPEKREYWANLWRKPSGEIYTGQSTYASEKEARQAAEISAAVRAGECVATVKVYEETI